MVHYFSLPVPFYKIRSWHWIACYQFFLRCKCMNRVSFLSTRLMMFVHMFQLLLLIIAQLGSARARKSDEDKMIIVLINWIKYIVEIRDRPSTHDFRFTLSLFYDIGSGLCFVYSSFSSSCLPFLVFVFCNSDVSMR